MDTKNTGPTAARRADLAKVLLVDDSATALLMTRMILRAEPYEVFTARDGREALSITRSRRPDVVVMDFVMPEMTGPEACRELRADAATRSIPVVMLSTRSETHHREAATSSGATSYLTKPVNGAELLITLRTLLGTP